jgi:hypothetical protein
MVEDPTLNILILPGFESRTFKKSSILIVNMNPRSGIRNGGEKKFKKPDLRSKSLVHGTYICRYRRAQIDTKAFECCGFFHFCNIHDGFRAGISEPSMGARNRVVVYRPASPCVLSPNLLTSKEPKNRFQGINFASM